LEDPDTLFDGHLGVFYTIYGVFCGTLRLTPQIGVLIGFITLFYVKFNPTKMAAMSAAAASNTTNTAAFESSNRSKNVKWVNTKWGIILVHTFVLTNFCLFLSINGIIFPNPWNFFFSIWFYEADTFHHATIASTIACPHDLTRPDLCLNEAQWGHLSAGMLSPHNPKDVAAVQRGLKVAREGGGIVLNILARDVEDSIPQLIETVQVMSLFLPTLKVVIFENDSVDNSRQRFKNWAKSPNLPRGVVIDLITCEAEGDADCKLKELHRYDQAGQGMNISITAKMAKYRNRLVDHILDNYADHSHMIAFDMDLAIPISVLGVLHSIGIIPNAPVTCRGIMPWQGSMGTQYVPYDMTAFWDHPKNRNPLFLHAHELMFSTIDKESPMHNTAQALSPFFVGGVQAFDTAFVAEPYRVASAFHGATIYPIKRMSKEVNRYDAGPNKQRCEHNSFNMSFGTSFINPKWCMRINPVKPGGPKGWRAFRIIAAIFLETSFWPTTAITYCVSLSAHLFTMWLTVAIATTFNLDFEWLNNQCNVLVEKIKSIVLISFGFVTGPVPAALGGMQSRRGSRGSSGSQGGLSKSGLFRRNGSIE
jgi:hypothetical protein